MKRLRFEHLESRRLMALTTRLEPAGSLVFEDVIAGDLTTPAEIDQLALNLDAGQTLSVAVRPLASGLAPTVELVDAGGTVIALNIAAADNVAYLAQAPLVAGGAYTLRVQSDGLSSGAYSVRLLLNAGLEAEGLNGPLNDTPPAAERLDSGFTSLGLTGGLRTALIGAGPASGGEADWFVLSLNDGQSASLALDATAASAATATLEFYAADGVTLLAQAPSGVSADRLLNGFVDATADSSPQDYLVKVITNGQYNLVALKDAQFESEPNDPTSQLLTPGVRIVGHIASSGAGEVDPLGSTVSVPVNITDGGGFLWDISANGSIANGTSDAYDGGLTNSLFGNVTLANTEAGGREFVLGPQSAGTVSTTRKIYVSPTSGFTRFLEIFTNVTASPVTRSFTISSNFGSDSGTVPVQTSSGDTIFNVLDDWIVTDDADSGGDPSLLHVVAGGGAVRPLTVSNVQDNLSTTYQLSLEPGETKIVMHFASQNNSRSAALQNAVDLRALRLGAMTGVTAEEVSQIVNFNVTSQDLDGYVFAAQNSDAISIHTRAPASGAGDFNNQLDPAIQVVAPSGASVPYANVAGDELLSFTAAESGHYRVLVAPQGATGGEYVLEVSGATGGLAPPFRVASQSLLNGASLAAPPVTFTVDFSDALLLSSVSAADLTLNGTPATSVTIIDSNTLQFTLPPATEGVNTLNFASGAILDLQSQLLQAHSSVFTLDTTAPNVIASSILEGAILPTNFLTYTAQFDDDLAAAGLEASDIRLVGSTTGARPATSVNYNSATRTFTALFSSLPDDAYTLTLVSGNGAFEGADGRDLDGEPLPGSTVPSGDGTAGGDFVVHFIASQGPVNLPAFAAVTMPGSQVYRASASGTLHVGDSDSYTVALDASQVLSLQVNPAAGLTTTISLIDPNNTVVSTVTSASAGAAAVLQSAPITLAGTYSIVVSESGGAAGGAFTLQAMLNSAFELESVSGASNETPATAENLDAQFRSLGPATATVAAVAGTVRTDNTDLYAFTLNANQQVGLALETPSSGNLTLELLNTAGQVITTGTPTNNLDRLIGTFVVTTAGVYFARIVGSLSDYNLVVTRNALFDAEPNNSLATQLQSITRSTVALGYTSPIDSDFYSTQVNIGDVLSINLTTPAAGPFGFTNTLDPAVELYDPSGVLVASSPTGVLTHTATAAGAYTVRVLAESSTQGEYVLEVTGATGSFATPLTVTTSTPANGGSFNATNAPTRLRVDLSGAVDLSTVQATDLLMNGQNITGVTVAQIDSDTVEFTFPTLANGATEFRLPAGSFTSLTGQALEAFASTITIDNQGPRIVSTSLQAGQIVGTSGLTFTAVFDDALVTATLDAADVRLRRLATGAIVNATSMTYDAATRTLTANLPALVEGGYELILVSSATGFQDAAGNFLDGELPAGTLPPNLSGNGTPGDDFVLPFTAEAGPQNFPALTALAPLGSLIHRETVSGAIEGADDVDRYLLNVDPAQTVTVIVRPAAGLTARLGLSYGASPLVTSADSAGPGGVIALRNIPTLGGGQLQIDVSGLAGSLGAYTVEVLLNADVESTALGITGGGTRATAQDLGTAFQALGTLGATRAGIAGTIGSPPASEDWYRFDLNDGQLGTIALEGAGQLELYDAAGVLLATGGDFSGPLTGIDRYRHVSGDGSAGPVFLRVFGATGAYQLVVTRGATFDLEPNNGAGLSQILAGGALGYVSQNATGGGGTATSLEVLRTFAGPRMGTSIPPDPTAAAGPEQVVALVNTEIAIYNKTTGAEQFRQSLNGSTGFFGSVGATTTIFDPWILYDTATSRFFAIAIDIVGTTQSNLYLAVSKTSTPTTGTDWHKYKLDFTDNPTGGLGTGAHFPDYPKLGVSEDAIWISGNYFAINAGSGTYAGITGLDKAALLAGGPATQVFRQTFAGFSVMPMTQYGTAGAQYFAEASTSGGSTINIHKITGAAGAKTRTVTTLSVPAFQAPPDIPELGGGVPVDSIDSRIMTGVWRNGSMWFAHGVSDLALGNTESVARWYQVQTGLTGSDPITLVQSGNVDPGPGLHAWIPAVAVDGAGSMGIGFAVGGPARYYGAGYTGRLASDPPGTTLAPFVQYAAGQAAYERIGGTRNRWGDYSAISIDPSDDSTFWVFNEYAATGGVWATQFASFQLQQPNSDDHDNYVFDAVAGDILRIEARTLAAGPGEFTNTLDVQLELRGPTGAVIPYTNRVGDELLFAVAPTSGRYELLVSAADSSGTYFVQIERPTGAEPPVTVTSASVLNGAAVAQFPTHVTLNFSEQLLVTSVVASDLLVGGLPALSVERIDADTYRFAVDPAARTGDGVYNIVLAAGAVVDLQQQSNAAFTSTFTLDTTGPKVVDVLLNNQPLRFSRTYPTGPIVFDAIFDEALTEIVSPRGVPFAPGATDIVLTNRTTGAVFNPNTIAFDATARRLTATFTTSLSEGEFRFTILSGDNEFEDLVGNDLDGEPVGPGLDGTTSGDGTPGGDYFVDFSVDGGPQQAPAFAPIDPLGGLIYATTPVGGAINVAGDQDVIEVTVAAGKTLSILARPRVATASLTVDIIGLAGSASSSAPGLPAALSATPLAYDAVYEVRVSGDRLTGYDVELFLNAALEAAVGDASLAQPLAIDSSFVELGSGRWGVAARSTGTVATTDVDLYTLDLTGRGGQQLGAVLAGAGAAGAVVELLSPEGIVVATSTPVPGPPRSIVWAAQSATQQILRIDPTNGQILGSFRAPGNPTAAHDSVGVSMAEGGSVLLYRNYDDTTFRSSLFRLNPITGQTISTALADSSLADGLGFVRNTTTNTNYLFYAHTSTDLHRQTGYGGSSGFEWGPGDPLGGVAGDDTGRLFAFYTDGMIHEVNPFTDLSSFVANIPAPASNIVGLAFDGEKLYASTSTGVLYSLNPTTGAILNSVTIAGGPLYGLGAAITSTTVNSLRFDDFVIPSSGGTYSLRVTSPAAGDYQLVVTESLRLESEPNNTTGAAGIANLATQDALGYLTAGDVDRHRLPLGTGQSVRLTVTPVQPTSGGALASRIRVLNAAGVVQAETTAAAAGVANLDWTAAAAGDYFVEVSAVSGIGECTARLTAATLRGDYNADGAVDAADYTVARDAFGPATANMLADGDRNGVVDNDDLAVWRSAFGVTVATATAADWMPLTPPPALAAARALIVAADQEAPGSLTLASSDVLANSAFTPLGWVDFPAKAAESPTSLVLQEQSPAPADWALMLAAEGYVGLESWSESASDEFFTGDSSAEEIDSLAELAVDQALEELFESLS